METDANESVIMGMFMALALIFLCSGCVLVICILFRVLCFVKKKLRTTDDKLSVGFFHPYCNAGGGGERVLWCAIKSIQNRYPHSDCIVYTGDTDASEAEIIALAKDRFNILLPKPVKFIFLHRRNWVEASRYPILTLLGQSLGSVVLGLEALMKHTPDIYIDTMGYAFTLPVFRYFGGCHIGCYVHYPTISTDMLQRVSSRTATYNNAAFISKSSFLSFIKLIYYHMFSAMYGVAGRCADVIMVNSSWTEGHILDLWKKSEVTHIVYPPCDINEFLKIPEKYSDSKPYYIVSIAQFRPEKDHALQLRAFAIYMRKYALNESDCKLVLVGSCRNLDDEKRVKQLKNLCHDLNITDHVIFKLNVSFKDLKQCMEEATIGLHTMWNEHFGIGVVELMAAGILTIAHNSGGPKLDIVIPIDGKQTGFLADSADGYAKTISDILLLSSEERSEIVSSAREQVKTFSEEIFLTSFISHTQVLFSYN